MKFSRSSLAATLAVGGLLALDANASVIYTDLSASPIVIDSTSSNSGQVLIDLDGDTATDFYLLQNVGADGGGAVINGYAQLQVAASGGLNEGVAFVQADPDPNAYAVPFAAGAQIDSSSQYDGGSVHLGLTGGSAPVANSGYWANGGTHLTPGSGAGFRGYAAFAVQLGDSFTHYGWADVAIQTFSNADTSSYAITLYGYAYESVAYTPILAGQTTDSSGSVPEPGSLLLLAAGAFGWRLRKPLAG